MKDRSFAPRDVVRVSVQRGPYGELIYPECEVALMFTEMLKQKTLTRSDVAQIKALGYEFEIVSPKPKLEVKL